MRAHPRAEVASACRACEEATNARRSTRRYCSGACRQAVWRTEVIPIAYQRYPGAAHYFIQNRTNIEDAADAVGPWCKSRQ
jgi:hypothetical protein